MAKGRRRERAGTAASPIENGCRLVRPAAGASTRETCTSCSVLVSATERKSPLPHLVSWAQLVNGKDLSRVQSLAENIYGSQLATKHPVSVGRLGGTQETLVVALQGSMKKKTKRREASKSISCQEMVRGRKKSQNTLIGCNQRPGKGPSTFWVIADVLVQFGPQHDI